jgi:hypothetical protein
MRKIFFKDSVALALILLCSGVMAKKQLGECKSMVLHLKRFPVRMCYLKVQYMV